MRWAPLAAALLLAGCGGGGNGASALDCEETRSTEVEPPARLADDPAAVAVWYLDGRGLVAADVVEEAPGEAGDSPAVLVKREGRVVGKVTLGPPTVVETCADFAA